MKQTIPVFTKYFIGALIGAGVTLLIIIWVLVFPISKEGNRRSTISGEILNHYIIPCFKYSLRKQGIVDHSEIFQRLESYLLSDQAWIRRETSKMSARLSGDEFRRFDERLRVYNNALNECKNNLDELN